MHKGLPYIVEGSRRLGTLIDFSADGEKICSHLKISLSS